MTLLYNFDYIINKTCDIKYFNQNGMNKQYTQWKGSISVFMILIILIRNKNI